jgi:DNA-binding transcriptional regulator YiaG
VGTSESRSQAVLVLQARSDIIRISQHPLSDQRRGQPLPLDHGEARRTDLPELTKSGFEHSLLRSVRTRLVAGDFRTGQDVKARRAFIGLTQAQLAQAIGISVHTLRNWEQDRRRPEGPAIALLRTAARHPRIIRESLLSAG